MKKSLILMISLVVWLLAGCEKKDTQAPLVRIIGPNPMIVSLNALALDDPGATAKDNVDGDLTASLKIETNVNLNKKGGYSIRYFVSDQAGNTGEAFRGVIVENRTEFLAGAYDVTDNKVDPQGTPTMTNYTDNVSTADTINDRFWVTTFGNHVNAMVYVNRNGNLLAIPQQEMSCGDPPVFRRFMGTGSILDSTRFVINYTETIGSAIYTGSGTYQKR